MDNYNGNFYQSDSNNENSYAAKLIIAQKTEHHRLFVNASKLGFLLLLYTGLNVVFKYAYYYVLYFCMAGKFTVSYDTVRNFLVTKTDFINSSLFSMLGNSFIVLLSMICLLIVAKFCLKISLKELCHPSGHHAKDAIKWFPLTMTMNLVVSIAISIFTSMMSSIGVTVPESDLSIRSPSTLTVIVQIFYVIILGPVCEELLYRGVIITLLKPYGKGMAVFFSALIFGAMHGNIPQAASAFASALVFGMIAIRCNSIIPTIIIHILNNFIASIADITDALGITNSLTTNIHYGLNILFILIGVYLLFTKAKELIIKDDNYAQPANKRYLQVATNVFILIYFAYLLREYVVSFMLAN